MNTQTQCARVAAWLKENGSLDPLTAWRKLGIYRLGARIYDLRQDGWKIRTVRQRRGKAKVAVYFA